MPFCCRNGLLLGMILVASDPGAWAWGGEGWMFRRSYFSHALPPDVPPDYPLPESRSAYRPAYYREHFGFVIQSAYRVNNYIIQNGPRSDRTFYREGYLEWGP